MDLPAIEGLGLIAGFLSAVATLPQSIRMIRLKDTKAVSTTTYAILVGSYVLWLVYGIIVHAISIIFWNIIAIGFGGTVLFIKFMYERKQT